MVQLMLKKDKKHRWLVAMLNAYYTTGKMVSFSEPELKEYAGTYLAIRKTEFFTRNISILYVGDWDTITTNSLHEAQAYIQESKRWYIHNLDEGTFVSETRGEWVSQDVFHEESRMRMRNLLKKELENED
jgi:hypothetical protein